MVQGSQCNAGATLGAGWIFRGPTRRSSNGAIDVRQLPTIIDRAASFIVTCASFSASATVVAEISGPTAAPVLNAGGAPGVPDDAADDALVEPLADAFWSSPRHAAATPSSPIGAWRRN
jgi:hypothetical protein